MMEPAWPTTRPAPETHSLSPTATFVPAVRLCSKLPPDSTATFHCGRPTALSFTSSRANFRISSTSGGSLLQADRRSGSPRRTPRSRTPYCSIVAPLSILPATPTVQDPRSTAWTSSAASRIVSSPASTATHPSPPAHTAIAWPQRAPPRTPLSIEYSSTIVLLNLPHPQLLPPTASPSPPVPASHRASAPATSSIFLTTAQAKASGS